MFFRLLFIHRKVAKDAKEILYVQFKATFKTK